MDFWHEFSKLETLVRNGFEEQACAVGRSLLLKLKKKNIAGQKLELLKDFCATNDIDIENAVLPIMQDKDIPIDDYINDRKRGISIVTACMNRNENLIKAVLSWIKIPEIDEILIVDWSSMDSVYLDLHELGIDDPRIRVVRIEGQSRWILTYAFNIGFRLAQYDTILKADADIILAQNFFAKNKLQRNNFITGDWRIASENQEHINGFFYITHDDLMKAHGFNEFISSYGWDDDDLYYRLQNLGLRRQQVDPETVYHLHHDDASRAVIDKLLDPCAVTDLENDMFFKIRTNRFIANSMPVWGRRSGFLPVSITKVSAKYLVAKQTRESFHKVAAHILDDGRYYAAAEMVSWRTSRRVYDLPKDTFWAYLEHKRLDELHRLDVSVLLHNDKRIDFNRSMWMINVYANAFNARFHRRTFVESLQDLCASLNVNIIIRITDELFNQCYHYLKSFKNLFCIPVSEAYGHIEFADPENAASELYSVSKPCYLATNLKLNVMYELIKVLEQYALATNPGGNEKCRRKIYIDAQHGLGNRLRSIASGAAIANASGRELVVVWQPDDHCEAVIGDLFDYDGMVLEESLINKLPSDVDCYNYMEVEPKAEKDALVILNHDKDVYVRTSCVVNSPLTNWEAENTFLKSLKSRSEVHDLIKGFSLENHVGVHIRMEGAEGMDKHSYERPDNWSSQGLDDLRYWRNKSHFSHFIKRIDRLLEEEPNTKIFLATDRAETYETFIKLYGNKLDYLKRSDFDRSRNQIIYAMADALLLSKCKRLIGSTWSSFTEIAMRYTDGYDSIEMSGKDF